MVFYPLNDWRYYFKCVWSVSKPQHISLVYSTQNQRYLNLVPFRMETGNSNKITHYCSNKLLNSKFLIWKNSVLLSSRFCLLLSGLKSQIILVQCLFHLQWGGSWSWPYLYCLHDFICDWMLEGLFSRHLEEYLSNGKHSVVLVAFVAAMIPRLLSSNILTTWGTQGPACLQMDQPSGHNWGLFVAGLLLTRTTGQSAPAGKEQETLLTSLLPSLFPLLNPSYPSLFF